MPLGTLASDDAFIGRYDKLMKGISRQEKIVNDVLFFVLKVEDAFSHTFEHLFCHAKNCLVFIIDKFQFCQNAVRRPSNNIILKISLTQSVGLG